MGTEVADANVKMMEKLSFDGSPAKWDEYKNAFHDQMSKSTGCARTGCWKPGASTTLSSQTKQNIQCTSQDHLD
jgi:hypothetical protein